MKKKVYRERRQELNKVEEVKPVEIKAEEVKIKKIKRASKKKEA